MTQDDTRGCERTGCSPDLEVDVEGGEEVSAEDEGVDGGENGVDPAGRDEERLALRDDAPVAHVHLVAEELLALAARRQPALVQLEVGARRPHQVEYLLSLYTHR